MAAATHATPTKNGETQEILPPTQGALASPWAIKSLLSRGPREP